MKKIALVLSNFIFLTIASDSVFSASATNFEGSAEYFHKTLHHENFEAAIAAFQMEDWEAAVKRFKVVIDTDCESALAKSSYYYLGVSYYKLGEYDCANGALNNYLKTQDDPKYFQEAVEYKFSIAEHFRGGVRRRVWLAKPAPKFLSGQEKSIEIYDEVIAALPSHELAAQSLFYKGCLLWKMRDWPGAIDSYQTLIRRFPKYEFSPQAYLNITKVLLDQSRYEFQNPDLLTHAEINVKKFAADFPRDELVTQAQNEVNRIKEVYAHGLFETACFYERVQKPKAAVIYYEKAIMQFPDTLIAQWCRKSLAQISPNALESIDQNLMARSLKQNSDEPQSLEFDSSNFNIEDFSLERS